VRVPEVVAVSDVRERIRTHVEREPGVHFRAVVRDLDLAPGQVQYHLRQLRRAGELIREEYAGRTHFFPPEYDAETRRQLAVLRRETARDIVLELADGEAARPAAVADAVGVARSTLEWHLERLVEEELVEKRTTDGGRVQLSLADAELVGRRLEAVEPAAPERLLDRYTRLVDALVSGD
jgi:predicted transcriptional regulator